MKPMEDYRLRKKKGLVLKLDLGNAYDYIGWIFLDYEVGIFWTMLWQEKAFLVNGVSGYKVASNLPTSL